MPSIAPRTARLLPPPALRLSRATAPMLDATATCRSQVSGTVELHAAYQRHGVSLYDLHFARRCCYNRQVTFLLPRLALLALSFASTLLAQSPQHLQVHVTLPAVATHGRLLVFAAKAGDKLPPLLSVSPFDPGATFVAARDLQTTSAGATVDVDTDAIAYPAGFSSLPAGTYVLQALLDVNRTYDYSGDDPVDWMSAQITVSAPLAAAPTLVLAAHPAANPRLAMATAALKVGDVEEFSLPSAQLTGFSGRPTAITGSIAYPPHYADNATARFPTVYSISGFESTHASNLLSAAHYRKAMESGDLPPMFVVLLDENLHTGTHEFVDSVNNGPWGSALVQEAIPALEQTHRMDARPSGRFLTGHSSGGWATLQLQINHSDVFGGTWSTSPDPSDFHNFTGVDLYAPDANMFHKADGTPYPLVRDKGQVIATVKQFSQLEEVLGTEGGQLNSFDWVFSPRGANGRPLPMYDRVTGAVDPLVVDYWKEHFDLAVDLSRRWSDQRQRAALHGTLHVYVGTADTFYLDGAAHLFDTLLQQLNAGTRVEFIPDRTHFDLYRIGDDRRGLEKVIFRQMYAVARPHQQ